VDGQSIRTQDVLKILGVSGLVVASILSPHLAKAFFEISKAFKDVNKKDLGRIVKRLEKQRMINFSEESGMIKIEITDKGKTRLLKYDYDNITIKKPKVDGKWRLIIFDIPEQRKRDREALRRKLLELGFIRLQDSVFASPYPCKEEIDFLANYLAVIERIERGEFLNFIKYKDDY
jgi:CRISPR/Cas system-associated endoribonuclease Cas2